MHDGMVHTLLNLDSNQKMEGHLAPTPLTTTSIGNLHLSTTNGKNKRKKKNKKNKSDQNQSLRLIQTRSVRNALGTVYDLLV